MVFEFASMLDRLKVTFVLTCVVQIIRNTCLWRYERLLLFCCNEEK
jgi:hypothetical protein